MKLSTALFIAAAFGLSQAAPTEREKSHRYVRLDGADIACDSAVLHHAGTQDVEQLKTLCSANDACLGFNSKGMLLRDVSVGCRQNDMKEGAALHMKSDGAAAEGAQLPVVPLPREYTWGSDTASLASEFLFMTKTTSEEVRTFMSAAAAEYFGLIITHRSRASNVTTGLMGMSMIVTGTDMSLGLATDESYALQIPLSGLATLTAETVYGARHGLETFSQLVSFDLASGRYLIANAPIAVYDAPRFAHRGMLLDSARHYHSVPVLRRYVRSLAHAKLNVFHWHLVDNQAFPLQMRSLDKIVRGAFSPQEIYTPEDVAGVVAYARAWGVRVIPEFDTPGHATAWCAGYPEICPSTTCTTPLNPATQATFDVIQKLITESNGLFPDDYLHLGGDEVDMKCWNDTASIRAWMDENKYTTDDAYKYFVAKTHAMARSLGRKSIHWEEVFNHFGTEMDKDTIFQAWLSHDTAARIVAAGYQCILSNQDAWYLDHLTITWQQFYANDPYMGIAEPKEQLLMLGGETCMWSETVDDSDLFNTVWPKAAAAAERLWSAANVVDTDSFEPRLAAFRCLLTRRGIGAAPMYNNVSRMAPPHPGSCFEQ